MINKNLIGREFSIKNMPPNFDRCISYNCYEEEVTEHEWHIGEYVVLRYFDGEDNGDTYDLMTLDDRYVTCELEEKEIRYMLNIGDKTTNTKTIKTKTEDKKMQTGFNMTQMMGDGFDFDTKRFSLSLMGGGVAVKVNGKDLIYKKDKIQDVTGFTMDANGMVMIMPSNKIAVGDTIIHNNEPVIVVEIGNNTMAIDLATSTKIELVKTSNAFGMTFYAKVFSMFGGGKSMGKMMPMMMMMGGKTPFGGSAGGDTNPIMQMMMMQSMMGGIGEFNFEEMFNFDGLMEDTEE